MPAWLLCVLGNPYCFSGSPSKGWIIIHRAISSDPVSIFECPLILDIVNSLFMKKQWQKTALSLNQVSGHILARQGAGTWRSVLLTVSRKAASFSQGDRQLDLEIQHESLACSLTSAGLQDNPWVCDCRLYGLVHLLEGWSLNLVLIEPRLRCASPRTLAGVAFSQLELRKCQSPELRPGVTSIVSPLGSTVLLRCGATGIPGPEMSWRRANGRPLNGTGV